LCLVEQITARKLVNVVTMEKKCGEAPPQSFGDYSVSVGSVPDGVELIEMI